MPCPQPDIVQKFATWNGKQCYQRDFSFSIEEILIFHFRVPKREFFVKEVPKNTLVIAPTHFIKLLDHIISTIHLLIDPRTFPRYFLFFDNFLLIQLEAGPI
jgi:hypothetical protein